MSPQSPQSKQPKGAVGPQLKARRQALKMSLAQVEIDTKIRGKFLTALESGDYSAMPNDVYSRGFVAHYANHLGLDGSAIAAAYAQERGGIVAGDTKRPRLARSKRIVFTGRVAAVLTGLVVAGAVFGYIVWEFSALAGAPVLAVSSPPGDEVVTGSVLDVSGTTTPGSDVSINNSPVSTDTSGVFSQTITLQNGVNAIKVTSQSKLGKATTITRNVLAKVPSVQASAASVPSQTIPGIDMVVTVSATTSVLVAVDGQTQFQGTFLAGTSKLFAGQHDISVTTGNAGATSLDITNSVAANKVIPSLGAQGEIRSGQDFTNSTVLP